MKFIIYILIVLGIYACTSKTQSEEELADTAQTLPPVIAVIDSLPIIPKEVIQKEYAKNQNVHSYHSIFKEEFAFNDWLTEITDKDSTQKINSQIDNLMSKLTEKSNVQLNLSDEWHLKYYVKKGWYQIGLDKTHVHRYYVSKANKYRLRGADLLEIFKPTDGWSANLIAENELIFQYGHWYPNGNQTSWEYSHVFVFSK